MRRFAPGSQEEQVGRLLLAGLLVLVLPKLPLGNYAIYPFTILSTWFHEMGHGLTALLLGFDFERLVLLADGSGYAETGRHVGASRLSLALVGAGGPLGPAVVGSLLILASAQQKFWRPALYALAVAIALSVVIWVRSMVGWIVLPGVALAVGLIAARAPDWAVRFALQFLGVQAALSMFQQWDYLLMERAVIGGRPMLSDTGAIEEYLFLPHWVWAVLIILAAAAMIGGSLKYALSRGPRITRR